MRNKRIIIGTIVTSILLITMFVIGMLAVGRQSKIGIVKGATANIQVYYYQTGSNKAYEIKEGDSIRTANLCVSNGKIIEVKRNGKIIQFEEEQALEEGEYSVTVENNGEILIRKFRVDNTAPIISGLKKSIFRERVVITFENIEDIVVATLELPQKDVVDLYKLYQRGKLQKNQEGKYIYIIEYSEANKGTYILTTKDAANNLYEKKIEIV